MRPRTAGSRSWTTPASRSARTSTIAPSNTSPTRPVSSAASTRSRQPRSYSAACLSPEAMRPGSSGRASRAQSGTGPPALQGHADLADEPVDEPSQGRGRVGVGRGDRGVHRVRRDLAVERRRRPRRAAAQVASVSSAACAGFARVEVTDDVARGRAVRPVGTPSACAESSSRSTSRGSASGKVRRMPMRPSSMIRAAHMPGEQRDLRVPLLDRERRAAAQGPGAVRLLLDHLLRGRQRDAATRLSAASRRVPTTSRSSRSVSSAVPSSSAAWAPVYVSCARLCTDGASHVDVHRVTVASRSIVHSSAGVTWSGSRLATTLAQHRRVQRCPTVRRVQRLDPLARLVVDRTTRQHPGGDVGDRVPHPEPVARRSMWTAWSRSFEPSGSMVTNGMSVASERSPSGARGRGASASAITCAGTRPAHRARRAGRRGRAARARRRPPPAPPAAGGRAAGHGVGARREPRRGPERAPARARARRPPPDRVTSTTRRPPSEPRTPRSPNLRGCSSPVRRRALLRAVAFGAAVSVPVLVLAYLVRAEAPGLSRLDEETIVAATSFTREHPEFLHALAVWQELLRPIWVNLAGGLVCLRRLAAARPADPRAVGVPHASWSRGRCRSAPRGSSSGRGRWWRTRSSTHRGRASPPATRRTPPPQP